MVVEAQVGGGGGGGGVVEEEEDVVVVEVEVEAAASFAGCGVLSHSRVLLSHSPS